ncbi:MAG: glycosyltransferase [Pirellulales bacterium]|nr:glycosyltransferase [Pirellulales bacterium]
MRVLHFSTADQHGGAAKVAFRLHQSLKQYGHASRMIVRDKQSSDDSVVAAAISPVLATWHKFLRHLPGWGTPQTKFTFNHDRQIGVDLDRTLAAQRGQVDVVFLHWITRFLSSGQIRQLASRLGVPLFWHLLDQEPLTGGCHYSFGCQGFTVNCGNCPLLAEPSPNDVSRQVWQQKQRHLADLPLTIIAPTRWAAEKARASSLFGGHRIAEIPLPLDTTVFIPADRQQAREQLGLPLDKRLVLFGASYLDEPRKGGAKLIAALHQLRGIMTQEKCSAGCTAEDVELVIIGQRGEFLARHCPFPSRLVGSLRDGPELARAYQAADLFVCPSIEDAGPMMISESLLCGTPVVAFDTGVAGEVVHTGQTGYLAGDFAPRDLARGIFTVLADPQPARLAQNARRIAFARHEPRGIIAQYEELYASVLAETLPRNTLAARRAA